MKNNIETITIKNIIFRIGYVTDVEFSGYVFEMKHDNKWYGVLSVYEDRREIGFRSGIFATNEEIEAIETARKCLYEKYGKNRYHG